MFHRPNQLFILQYEIRALCIRAFTCEPPWKLHYMTRIKGLVHPNHTETFFLYLTVMTVFFLPNIFSNLPLKLLLHNFYNGSDSVIFFFPGAFTQHSPYTMLWTIFWKKSQTNQLTVRTLDGLGEPEYTHCCWALFQYFEEPNTDK